MPAAGMGHGAVQHQRDPAAEEADDEAHKPADAPAEQAAEGCVGNFGGDAQRTEACPEHESDQNGDRLVKIVPPTNIRPDYQISDDVILPPLETAFGLTVVKDRFVSQSWLRVCN